ncbi:MAG: FAD:protein FMN transferase [Clostridia bacterium]|nr:FAD:protein FMN transferase [Clostridia bacterium]
MTKRNLMILLLAAMMLFSSCAAQPPAQAAAEKTTATGFYFDTVVTFTLYGAPEGMMDELLAECARYERMLSKTIDGSDVSRMNAAGGETVTVDAETWNILARAKEISALTGQTFCVTIAPLTALWDFTGGTNRMPTEQQRLDNLPLVDDEALILGEGNTVTLKPGMQIELGGIAKGYIADRLADKVRGKVVGAILNFGGNVYAVGCKPEGAAFRVGVRDPKGSASDFVAIVDVTDKTVVTSGTYERFFVVDGVTYHHILDPKDGLPARSDLAGATIVGESSMDADALATACIVLGREKALAMLNENGFDGILIDTDGNIFMTDGLQSKYPVVLMKP